MKKLIILLVLLSSCVVGPRYSDVGHYEIVYSRCPIYPETEHYRMVGKQFDPNQCNYIDR